MTDSLGRTHKWRSSDIAAGLARQYDFDEGMVRLGYCDSRIAVISLPFIIGNVVISRGEVRNGWTICRIRERGGLSRCCRCLESGHIPSKC